MNKELWLVIYPALGWLLFALGGTQISDKIEGKKWIRRFVLPVFWGIGVLLAGFAWFQALGVAVIACGAFHLGYGSKTRWPLKLATFSAYGLISAPIGLSVWNLNTMVGCAIMFLLSNLKPTSKMMVWKIVEGCFGALIGIQIGYLMAGYGWIW